MAKDVIARLKADTNQWDSGMAKATRSLNNFQKQNMSTDAVLKMGIGTLTKFASVAALTGAAVEGFRKYMASTEGTADALAQAQRTLTTVTNEFFRSLNDGSFSSFLGGLDDIISRAQSAYQALDELGSFAVRYNPKNAVDMQQIDSLMKQARAAKAKGDTKEAEHLLNEAKKIADQAKKSAEAYGEKEAQAGFATMREKLGDPFKNASEQQLAWYADPKNWDTIKKNAKDYQDQLKKIDDLTKKAQLGHSDEALKGMRFYGQGGRVNDILKARKELIDEQEKLKKIQEKGIRAQTYLNTRDSGEEGQEFINAHQQIYGRQRAQFASDAIQARIDRQDAITTTTPKTPKTPKATKPEEIIPEGSIAEAEKKIKELQEAWRNATTQDDRNNFAEQLKEANAQLDIMKGKVQEVKLPEIQQGVSGMNANAISARETEIKERIQLMEPGTDEIARAKENLKDLGTIKAVLDYSDIANLDMEQLEGILSNIDFELDIPDEQWESIVADINEQLAALNLPPIKLNVETGGIEKVTADTKSMQSAWSGASKAIGAASSALSQIEDPGAKIAGIIGSALATLAQTYAMSLKGAVGPWDWAAAAITGAATLASISGVLKQSAEYHADGGVVGGSPFIPRGTDTVPAMLTPGEIVLNAAQQKSLASNLEGLGETSIQATTIETKFKGEDLVSVINVHARRTNRKEILK